MPERPVAVFVSPHGFGHAARAAAVLDAMAERSPDLRFEIFTSVPEWFFADSLRCPWRHHEEVTDLGLVQRSAIEEDPLATAEHLAAFVPPDERQVDRLADRVRELGCRAVMCDIAPLGLAVAARAGLSSVLVENFTWDSVYRAYGPPLDGFAEPIRRLVEGVDLHLQTEPVCWLRPGAIRVPPVSRPPRSPRPAVRQRLGVPAGDRLVLLTMGGLAWDYRALELLEQHDDAWFVVPGGSSRPVRRGRLISLPHRCELYHPDLVAAADVVVGKLGYSTVAEVVHSEAAFLYLRRERFPESPFLEAFVRAHVPSAATDPAALDDGRWLHGLAPLLEAPRSVQPPENGRGLAAERVLELIP